MGLQVRRFPDTDPAPTPGARAPVPDGTERGVTTAWRGPGTLLIGVCALAFACVEGTGNDWISIAIIDGHGVSPALGGLAHVALLTAMTATRWFAPAVLDRHGRVLVVRVLAVITLVGVALFVHAPNAPLAFCGVLLRGAGVSLGRPVSLSAAADDPRRAAGRVSAVASTSSCAFLAGPPLIGSLGAGVGVLHALTAVVVLLALTAVATTALRPRTTTTSTAAT